MFKKHLKHLLGVIMIISMLFSFGCSSSSEIENNLESCEDYNIINQLALENSDVERIINNPSMYKDVINTLNENGYFYIYFNKFGLKNGYISMLTTSYGKVAIASPITKDSRPNWDLVDTRSYANLFSVYNHSVDKRQARNVFKLIILCYREAGIPEEYIPKIVF